LAATFILPHFTGFLLFTLVPVAYAFFLSTVEWDFANPMTFVGLANFVELFGDEAFLVSLRNSIVFTVTSVPLTLVISLGIAVLLNSGIRGIVVYRSMIFFPNISSVVAIIFAWKLIFHPALGPINQLLRLLGWETVPGWTSAPGWSLVSVIIFCTWWGIGYYMIIFLAGLKSIPSHLYESATIDGANPWQKLVNITIPMLGPTIFFALIICSINAFKVFEPVMLLTEGGPGNSSSVLGYFIYKRAFVWQRFGYASASAVVLFTIILTITFIQFRVQKKWVTYLE
jgi:ABC-type sugar transport system permease subunit